MSDREAEFFNCSEAHEVDQAADRYIDHKAVKEFIRKKCKDGTISGWTHGQLYAFLDEQGFERA